MAQVKWITSASNPLIKELIRIKTNARFRAESGVVLIEGEKLIRDVAPRLCLLSTDEKWIECFEAKESYLVTPEILRKIASTENPEGVLAVVDRPRWGLPKKVEKLLVLDRIQDPGNVGVLIRTAFALGWDGIFLLEGTVDPLNDKAIRAAKGATFKVPIKKGNFLALKEIIENFKLTLVAADMKGETIGKMDYGTHVALALGNEGQGIAEEFIKEARLVSIPMREDAESLNVAVSGAILMYEFSK